MSLNFSAFLDQYRAELLDRTIPFWLKYGVDWNAERGGICTCIADDGRVLSDDKYMWSQLRAIWTFSALCNKIERRKEWLDVAEHIFAFVKKYGRDEQGQWVFLVSKDGKPLQGATSIYADGFAIYGLTELAKATGNQEAIQLARETYANVQRRLARPGSYGTAPLPIPAGAKAHGISMIFSLVFTELGYYLNDSDIINAGLDHANQVMTVFRRPEHKRLYEFAKLDHSLMDTPPGRTVNPGHAIESMWFMIHIYQRQNDQARIRQAIEAIKWHIELGWDEEYGGILLARDAAGSFWENKWDTKIWWPHTEALYGLLLAYSISKEDWCLEWFKRVHDYAFAHFPVPQYGEWIQNLDRRGNKLNATVALPVKDPFHLSRALIYSVGVLEKLAGR
jgi:N-acylglucosamine 2-epimerase